MNNKDAVYDIIMHLIENGHESVGFVRSPVNTHNFFLRDEGIPPDDDRARHVDSDGQRVQRRFDF